jgi:hypothetical protein
MSPQDGRAASLAEAWLSYWPHILTIVTMGAGMFGVAAVEQHQKYYLSLGDRIEMSVGSQLIFNDGVETPLYFTSGHTKAQEGVRVELCALTPERRDLAQISFSVLAPPHALKVDIDGDKAGDNEITTGADGCAHMTLYWTGSVTNALVLISSGNAAPLAVRLLVDNELGANDRLSLWLSTDDVAPGEDLTIEARAASDLGPLAFRRVMIHIDGPVGAADAERCVQNERHTRCVLSTDGGGLVRTRITSPSLPTPLNVQAQSGLARSASAVVSVTTTATGAFTPPDEPITAPDDAVTPATPPP